MPQESYEVPASRRILTHGPFPVNTVEKTRPTCGMRATLLHTTYRFDCRTVPRRGASDLRRQSAVLTGRMRVHPYTELASACERT